MVITQAINMLDPKIIGLIVMVFVLAGMVKGVVGLGLPTISLALLTIATDLTSAMALMLAPSFMTNVWQMVDGGNSLKVFKRIWPFLATAAITVWIGALALTRVDSAVLISLLGALVIVYALIGLTGFRLSLASRIEPWVGPLVGAVNGVFTGMTGSFVFPGLIFLQSIGLQRDALIQAMGMLFTVSTVALAFALNGNGLINAEHGFLSLFAVIPALVGMYLGRRIRQRLSETVFRRVFFIALLLLGSYLVL